MKRLLHWLVVKLIMISLFALLIEMHIDSQTPAKKKKKKVI